MTDHISRFSEEGTRFLPRKFQGFPEIKEALIANRMQAGFLVAPMAIALRSQGVPIKIVYLGHRYGSAVVVRSDGPVRTVADLAGRTVAIPSRFSDEHLIVLRALQTMGPQLAYGLVARLEQVAQPSLTLNQGTLYPALVRLEQKGWIKGSWQRTESNREAKYYTLTKAGERAVCSA